MAHTEQWMKQSWKFDRVYFDFDVDKAIDIVNDENYATLNFQPGQRDTPPPGFTGDLNAGLIFAEGRLQYQGGTLADRVASIDQNVGEPRQYLVTEIIDSYSIPSLGDQRARIQMVCSNCVGIKHFAVKYKIRIPKDTHDALTSFNGVLNWLSLFEIHNNAAWLGQGFDGSISMGVTKDAAPNSPLYFYAAGRDYDAPTTTFNYIWRQYSKRFYIPYDEWFEVNIEVSEGTRQTGAFRMWVIDAAGDSHYIFNVRDFTQNVYDPAPAGMADINPIKWYTSQAMMNWVHDTLGKTMVAHFKEMKMLGSTQTACHFDEI